MTPDATAEDATDLWSSVLAHSAGHDRKPESLGVHLERVARYATAFAKPFGAEDELRFASFLHDAGKCGERFQARLRGAACGVDHWSIGARIAIDLRNRDGLAAALAIEGHHTGLQVGANPEVIRRMRPRDSWSVTDAAALRRRLAGDGFDLTPPFVSVWDRSVTRTFEAMFAVRMVFSALVDADYLATELHFDGEARPGAPPLDPETIEALVEEELQHLATGRADPAIQTVRRDVGDACRAAADSAPGLFTLAAPTGSGKTLAMLLFAARHAKRHGLRRIVVALPYLTITDQTVRTYSRVLAPWLARLNGGAALLEHHSLAGLGVPPGELECERERRAENWDAPIVVTTTVQLFQSLFADRPGACRKLHSLAQSVILLDEVQTIPSELAVPAISALSCLADRYGATAVLATATQPAFAELHEAVTRRATRGWTPREICAPALALFGRKRRYSIEWLARGGESEDDDLVGRVLRAADFGSVLLIANLKRQAIRWLERLDSHSLPRLDHLSTNMTPAHRRRVLDYWGKRENTRGPGQVLVATQCVEAGVDLDVPALFRAFAPLDSLAQAAGRVNRNGSLPEGRLVVFLPHESGSRLYPDAAYAQAADEAFLLLQDMGWPPDLERPPLFEEYFRRLYRTRGTAERTSSAASAFDEAVDGLDFPRVADLFRLIPKRDVLNVLCPDGPEFEDLARRAKLRLSGQWAREAQLHAVNVFRPGSDSPAWAVLEPVMVFNRSEQREEASEWCVLRDRSLYDERLGLRLDRCDGGAVIA
jgi:CRISPR-associated helicase Cas3/CRISPR-associated endonuclease Cas3-HD